MAEPPPILLTPGPVSTAPATRAAMQADPPPWDAPFKALTRDVAGRLVHLAGGDPATHLCVPLPGSGSYAVEAMAGTLLPRPERNGGGRLLVPCNGNYGKWLEASVRIMGRDAVTLDGAEDAALDPQRIADALAADPAITHVGVVHVETTTGLFNPVDRIAEVVHAARRRLWVDVVASLGILPVRLNDWHADAVASSSNKGIEGVPGCGFVIARRDALLAMRGNAHSLSLDVEWQGRFFEESQGRFRYTPPTHVVAAFAAALDAFEADGGQPARFARYSANCRTLREGLEDLGFMPLIAADIQAPVIVTCHAPPVPAWNFDTFYRVLKDAGFIIFPGKVTQVPSFRIGCIGQVQPADMERVVAAARAALDAMGLRPRSWP